MVVLSMRLAGVDGKYVIKATIGTRALGVRDVQGVFGPQGFIDLLLDPGIAAPKELVLHYTPPLQEFDATGLRYLGFADEVYWFAEE